MCVGKPQAMDSGGALQQGGAMMSPLSAMMGSGHLRGMAPEARSGLISLTGEAARGATKLVPIVGPVFNIGKDIADADYDSAASRAAMAGVKGVSPSMMRVLQAMDGIESGAPDMGGK